MSEGSDSDVCFFSHLYFFFLFFSFYKKVIILDVKGDKFTIKSVKSAANASELAPIVDPGDITCVDLIRKPSVCVFMWSCCTQAAITTLF